MIRKSGILKLIQNGNKILLEYREIFRLGTDKVRADDLVRVGVVAWWRGHFGCYRLYGAALACLVHGRVGFYLCFAGFYCTGNSHIQLKSSCTQWAEDAGQVGLP